MKRVVYEVKFNTRNDLPGQITDAARRAVIRTHVPRYAVSQRMAKLMEATVENNWLK
jgi:hypothetical protein